MEGVGDCDRSQLSAQELSQVTRATSVQILQSCLTGVGPCDSTVHDQADKQETAKSKVTKIGRGD